MDIERIGKYKIVAEIGRGTMGQVYKAHDPVLNRFVAIKTLASMSGLGDEKHQRFQREAQAAALLSHMNIVTVHDFGEEQGLLFMAMELLEGTDLREAIDRDLLKTIEDKISVMDQILAGLAFAHSKGVIHRDLKPANVHIQPNGQVKIVDFGLARVSSSDMTQEGIVLGTPNYMSPEQAMGDRVDARSDIFSAGAVFYEILSNHKPFDADSTPGVLFQVVHKEPVGIRQWTPDVPRVLVDVVEKALVKDKTLRFQTARQMKTALSIARTALAGGADPDASLAEASQRASRAAGNQPDPPVFRSSSTSSGSGSGSHPGYVEGTVALDMSPVAKSRGGSKPAGSTLSGSASTHVPRGRSGRVRPVPRKPAPLLTIVLGAALLLGLVGGAYMVLLRKHEAPETPSPAPSSNAEVSALTTALAETQLQLAMRDLEDKNYDAAVASAERVLKIAPGSPAARRIVEQARRRKQQLDSAVTEARQALEAGNTAAASQSLSQILEIDPRHPAATELSTRLNTAFRSKAEDAARSMRQARSEAEKAKATGDAYTEAVQDAQEGEALFTKGEFANATRAFLEARDGFDRGRRAARAPVAAATVAPPALTPGTGVLSAPSSAPPPASPVGPTTAASAAPSAPAVVRRFVAGKTVIATRRARNDLQGFDTADVKQQKMPDFVGRIDFETAPLSPAPGQEFSVRVYLVNEGKKPLRLKTVGLVTTANAVKTPASLTPLVREIAPAQRAMVAELHGVWGSDVDSWSLEAVVTSDRDETGTSRLSWN
jgi:serine/threonine protein kinase/Tfp pilus assembly protein PilF